MNNCQFKLTVKILSMF